MEIGARELESEIRKRIQDQGVQAWTPAEILRASDTAIKSMSVARRQVGEDQELDREDVLVSAFTVVEPSWYEYELPAYVQSVRKVEGLIGNRPVPISQGMLEDKNANYSAYRRGQLKWVFSRHGRPGAISLFGNLPFQTVRLWFIRRHPPLHYGVGGAAGADTSHLAFDTTASRIGKLIPRVGIYVGMDVVFDAGAADEGLIARITAFDGALATFSPAVGSSTAAQPYSIVAPVDYEFDELLIQKATYHLFSRAGNTEYMQAAAAYLGFLDREYKDSLDMRSNDAPERLWSSRQ